MSAMLDQKPLTAREGVLSAIRMFVLLSIVLLAFYVSLYPIKGFRVAIGSDTSVYVWWARYAGATGLGSLWVGRPGTVGLLAALSKALGQPVSAVAASMGPVMAVTAGLSMAALVQSALGSSRLRFALSALLTGTFLSLLVGGYLSTLAFGTLFIAALACLSEGLEEGDWRPIAAACILLGAAGLAHPQFLLLGWALVLGGLVALVPPMNRGLANGERFARTSVGRVVLAGGGGLMVTAVGVGAAALAGGIGPGLTVDTSRDGVLRRTGLSRMVRDSYREKLVHDFPWHRAAAFPGLALTALAGCGETRRARHSRGDGRNLFWGVLIAWLVVTAGAVIALLLGLPVPGQRLAAFCLPLPALAAVGLSRVHERFRARGGKVAVVALAVGLGLFLVPAWLGWGNQRPVVPPEALSQATVAGRALAGQPPGTPLVLVGDIRTGKPGFLVVRYANYLRGAVPGHRAPDVHVFVGSVGDFMEGRPTLTGHPEHDRIARSYWANLGTVLTRDPVAVSMQSFHEDTYLAAAQLPGASLIGPGVVVLPGFGGPAAVPGSDSPDGSDLPEEGPLSPWTPVWLSPILLGLVAAVGWPWSRLALGSSIPLLQVALAPAFGLAAVGVASLLADAAGLRLSGTGGFAALAAAMVGALVSLRFSSRRPWRGRPAAVEPPQPDRRPL